MRRVHAVIALLLACAVPASSQIGSWRTYTDMQEIRDLAVHPSGSLLAAATGGGVFTYAPSSHTLSAITNAEGLTSNDVRAVILDSTRIIVGASTGVLDIRDGDGWSSIPDIARATEHPLRGINVLRLRGNALYIGTDFGVVVFDLAKREFADSYLKLGSLPSQSRVLDILVDGDSIWAATDQGLAVADLRGSNLQDPSQWRSYTAADGLASQEVHAIRRFGGIVYAGTALGVSALSHAAWIDVFPRIGLRAVGSLQVIGGALWIVTAQRLFRTTSIDAVDAIGDSLTVAGASFTTVAATQDSLYIASTIGVSSVVPGRAWMFVKPNGPNSNRFLSLSIDDDGTLWSASGTGTAGRGFYGFDGTRWSTFTRDRFPILGTDEVKVTAPGFDGDMYFGMWGSGVVRRKRDGTLERYDGQNVPGFPGITTDPKYYPINGIARDPNGRMWFLHYQNSNGNVISCLSADGTWRFFKDAANPEIIWVSDLIIDQLGEKWFWSDFNFVGVAIFDDNGTLDNASDDTWRKYTAQTYSADRIRSIAIDRLGDIWIGTDLGLRAIFNPRTPDVHSRPCRTTICNIEGQSVNCIAIDPVGNKWIGTNEGVFVLTPDGSQMIAQYNTGNSPIVDDAITSIAVHPATGVAYIGTNNGLSALQTPYIEPSLEAGTIRFAPNPFRVGRDAEVTIDGLAEGSTLKILSVSGSLVNEIPTPGGRVGSWNGRMSNGEYAPSGIYFIVAYGMDGSQVTVGKLAVIRE